jgi:hypothetical protein
MPSSRISHRRTVSLLRDVQGAALLEFAISLPLLVVFVVGIYDFSGAFNQKQKIEQAAQEGAIVAGAEPTSDIHSSNGSPSNPNPDSLQAVSTAVFNSLVGSGVVSNATCTPPGGVSGPAGPTNLTWTYTISRCNGAYPNDSLVIAINRGWFSGTQPTVIGTMVTVTYPYHWQFNRVIQLLVPGASYLPMTSLSENATVNNQM